MHHQYRIMMSYRNRMAVDGKPEVVVSHWVHDEVLDRLARFSRPSAPARDQGVRNRGELRAHRRAAGLMTCMADRVDDDLLAGFPALRVVAGVLKGHDSIDVEACTRRGVWVTVLPDLLTAPTAELTVGLMITLMRDVIHGDAQVRAGRFQGWRPQFYGQGLAGARVGLIGMGRLGQAVARRARAFDADIAYSDHRALPDDESRALDARLLPLDELLATSDVLVPLVPLTPSTRHLLDARALNRARPGAFLVNAGRGSVVDEEAVADALAAGRLAGYAADVFAFEDWSLPDRPRTIPPRLLRDPRTVFTPHLGSAVDGVRRQMGLAAADQVRQALTGQEPDGAVNTIRPRSGPARDGRA